MKYKKIAVYGLCALAFSIGSVLYDQYERSARDDKFTSVLSNIVQEANKNTPRMIDESTRLEYVTTEGQSTIAMRYTLPGVQLYEVDSKVMLREIKPAATKQVCNGLPSRQFMKAGGSYGYEYADEVGRRIIKFSISEADCT